MPSFKLDGQEIPFQPGDSIIKAAWRQGIEIPHYCWHPGLSSPANCRMCLVEIKSDRQAMMPVLKWDESKQATTETICPYCGVGCVLDLTVQDNKIVRVMSPTDSSVTNGNLCIKGRFGFGFVSGGEASPSDDEA